MALMLVIPAWAMIWQAFVGDENTKSWLTQGNWLLVSIASIALVLQAWLVIEALVMLRRGREAIGNRQ
jgi:hypothetical protein